MSTLIETQTGGPVERRSFSFTRIFPGALLTGAFAALATEVVAWLAVGGMGVSSDFAPLSPGATAPVTIIASLVAMFVYLGLQWFKQDAERAFIKTSLAALALSFVPLLAMALNPSHIPGTTAAAILALAAVHVVAYAVIMIGLVCTTRAMEEGL